MKYAFEWEKIHYNERAKVRTCRAKVIGGWVLRVEAWDDDSCSESSVFIPDPEHKWDL